VKNVTDRIHNPFGMRPDCESFVAGYGDANADFHVIGDHPGVHGGLEHNIPFTGESWSTRFLEALAEGGLLDTADPVAVDRTFLSYRHMCLPDGDPTPASDADMERFFDAELRAIAAHVLLPVGSYLSRGCGFYISPAIRSDDARTERASAAGLVLHTRLGQDRPPRPVFLAVASLVIPGDRLWRPHCSR